MVVVIRLQGLKFSAGSEDIRNFFTGLRIPDGGVHIIGGKLEEAFIIFTSDEDARRAMTRSGGCIKGSPVNLLLSSKSEMQKVLEESTQNPEANNRRPYRESVKRQVVEGRHHSLSEERKLIARRGSYQNLGGGKSQTAWNDSRSQMTVETLDKDGLFLYLSGMPFSATKEDVVGFFEDLQIDDIVFLQNQYGIFNGCGLVKFGTSEDASAGLKRDRKYIGHRYVRVMTSSENQWVKCGGFVKPEGTSQRRHFSEHKRSRSPIRSRSHSPSNQFFVLFENLPYSVGKRDIRALLHPMPLTDDQIIILVESRDRKSSAIVMFKNLKDYCAGLAHHKGQFLQRVVYASPISKDKMATRVKSSDYSRHSSRRSSRSSEHSPKSVYNAEKRYLYVRNLPFDVRKVEIVDFFYGFKLSEDRIVLLQDERGAGLGEALVTFQTEKQALMAQSLNGQRFLGSEVILTCITWDQMQTFDINHGSVSERNSQGYDDSSNFPNEQMCPDHQDSTSNVSDCGPGNNRASDQFEKSNDYGRDPHEPGHHYGPAEEQFNRPTCVKLLNLPSKIRVDEIYDFCYGYRVIPGSVSLQYNRSGVPTGTATVVFETHSEAMTALQELNGRPIGTRKVTILFQ